MLPKHYSAIHLLTTSPSKPKKLLITKLHSCTQQNTVFLCTSFFASTSVYIWGSLLSIPNLFFLTLSRPCVSLPLTQAANVFKYTDNCIGQVCDGNDNQATAIHGFTQAFSQLENAIPKEKQNYYISKQYLVWQKLNIPRRKTDASAYCQSLKV